MHLLNDSNATHSPPLDLPPIHKFPSANYSSLSLPPLDLDNPVRGDAAGPRQQLPPHIPSLYALAGDDSPQRQASVNDAFPAEDVSIRLKRSNYSISRLLGDPEVIESPHSLRSILDDQADTADDLSNKKRQRAVTTKDELIQLPQPLKKQKSSSQVLPRSQVVPPMINGLIEPPPNASLFPPISVSSAEFDDGEAFNPTPLKDYSTLFEAPQAPPAPSAAEPDKTTGAKLKRRAAKPRRKWSEEETNHLLLGVSRHGVGKWTNILEDADFKFNERTAGDLKDRFRTCCPDELRGKLGKRNALMDTPTTSAPPEPKLKTKSSLTLESILQDSEDLDRGPSSSQQDSDSAPKQRKSRAHRKKMEDLKELGIHGPFKKSHRRERRPFTEQDDKEILDGLDHYGPAWTKIQRDSRFNLATRQPTDLRDRVRNKYPEIYARIEKGNLQVKDHSKPTGLLEPSINTMIDNSLVSTKSAPLEATLNRTSSKEDMPRWPAPSTFPDVSESLPSQTFDQQEPSATALLGDAGEMDISRLLIKDSQLPTVS